MANDKIKIKILTFALSNICILTNCNSNKQKLAPIFQAVLINDRSSIHMDLFSDNTFSIQPITYMGNVDPLTGKYRLSNDTVYFLDPPYSNDFIPRQVRIIGNKVVLRLNEENEPDTSFANFFEIRKNVFK